MRQSVLNGECGWYDYFVSVTRIQTPTESKNAGPELTNADIFLNRANQNKMTSSSCGQNNRTLATCAARYGVFNHSAIISCSGAPKNYEGTW